MDALVNYYNSQVNDTHQLWNISDYNGTAMGFLTFDNNNNNDKEIVKGPGHWAGPLLIYMVALPALWLCWISILNELRRRGIIGQREATHVMQDLQNVTIPSRSRITTTRL